MQPADESTFRKPRRAHIWRRSNNGFYVEPEWCSERLFDVEPFVGEIIDPACGLGRIVTAAATHGYCSSGLDIAQRAPGFLQADFFEEAGRCSNIVTNPPFDIAREFAFHALELASRKVAIIFPTARLNAARWLEQTPLARIWLLTPRPSMPPGEAILRGEKPGGGKVDFCWLVFEVGYCGASMVRWLRRDGATTFEQLLDELAGKK